MTFTVRAYRGAQLADCVAFGDDPEGFARGDYQLINGVTRPDDLVGCTAW